MLVKLSLNGSSVATLELSQGLMDQNRIRDARKRSKLTQVQLADIVGIAPSQISRFESGKRRPRLDEAIKIAEKLNLQLSDIVENGESEPARSLHSTITSLPLPEGRAVIEYPAGLSSKSRQALKEWLELIARLTGLE
jgi:transcriptional regulator with XRE-family HTH domain